MEVVDSEEAMAQNFFFNHKVAKIASGKSLTAIARTADDGRFFVFCKFFFCNVDMGKIFTEKISVAREARGDNAVKHVYALCDARDEILWFADAHQVSRAVFWQKGSGERDDAPDVLLLQTLLRSARFF